MLKAIRGLGSEVEGTAFTSKDENENGNIWLTTQHKVCELFIFDFGECLTCGAFEGTFVPVGLSQNDS